MTCLLLVIVYQPIHALGFASIDDQWMLLDYQLVNPISFNFSHLYSVFTDYNSLQYAPINTLFYSTVYQINGFDPFYYHIANLAIHFINIWMVFKVCCQLLERFEISMVKETSIAISLLWAFHPFNVEAVVWISGSKILLYTLFGLISTQQYIFFLDRRKWVNYVISLFFFLISCLSKEQAVILPLVFFAIAVFSGIKLDKNRFLKYGLNLLPFFLIALIFGLITMDALSSAIGAHTDFSKYPFMERITLSCYCMGFYIFNTFIPLQLHYHYPFPMKPGERLPTEYYVYAIGIVIFIIVCTFRFKKNKNYRFYLFCSLFFLINIGLCIQVVPLSRPAMMADRYMYLPLLGILMLMISEGYQSLILFSENKLKHPVLLPLAIFCLALLLECLYSHYLVTSWSKFNL